MSNPDEAPLTAQIAVRVMGWRAWLDGEKCWRLDVPGERTSGGYDTPSVTFDSRTGEKERHHWWDYMRPPGYDVDISTAWEVVDRMNQSGWLLELWQEAGEWRAVWKRGKDPGLSALAPTAAEAICLAAIEVASQESDPAAPG